MNKTDHYTAVLREIDIRLEKGGDFIADLSNITAVLKKRLSHADWVGFYFYRDNQLVLGPFQGNPACVYIGDQGVCGTCVQKGETIIVPDVALFPGHIPCDPNSRSEIVVPCYTAAHDIAAVIDMDSNILNAFDDIDRYQLELLSEKLKLLWRRTGYD